jgi:hypothetical protein
MGAVMSPISQAATILFTAWPSTHASIRAGPHVQVPEHRSGVVVVKVDPLSPAAEVGGLWCRAQG